MSCYVFLGPTLPAAAAASLLDAVYLPPCVRAIFYGWFANSARRWSG